MILRMNISDYVSSNLLSEYLAALLSFWTFLHNFSKNGDMITWRLKILERSKQHRRPEAYYQWSSRWDLKALTVRDIVLQ
jgi:hypothetical protein